MQASVRNMRMASSSRVRFSVRASAAVAPPKAKACKPGKDSLFLFKWTRPSGGNTEMTIKQLKALEQVSKDALWFTVKDAEAEDHQHVLVVTNDAKTAKKYQLLELEGDAPVAVSLDGLPEPVQVPLPSIRSALQQRLMMEDDSSDSSDSDEEDMMPTPKMTKMTKKEKKGEKDVLTAPETVPENPLAAQQAAALLGPSAEAPMMAPADGHGTTSGAGGAVAELVLGMVTKQERRKLKDCVRDVERDAMTPAGMPATANMMMEEDTSSSSSSGGSSESEDDEMDMTKMDKKEDKKKMDKKKEKEAVA